MSHFTNEAAATGDEALAAIRKSAEATRRPNETPEQAFCRFLESNPGLVAEMGRQAALAKRRAAGPLASLPDPAFDKLMDVAKRTVDEGEATSVPVAFAKLWEARDPDVRRLVKAAKMRSTAALGGVQMDDDDEDTVVADPVDTGSLAATFDYGRSGDLDDRGTQGATGQGRNRGRAKMFSELVPHARPVATARNQGSYDPKRRSASATRTAPARVMVSDYGRPEPQAPDKTAVRKAEEDPIDPVVARAKRLVEKGFGGREALYIASAPSKAERRRLRKRFLAQMARAA